MRFLIGFFFSTCLIFAQNVDSAIKQNQAKIQKKIAEQNKVSKKIKELGEQIESQNNDLKTLVEKIQILEREIEDNQGIFLEEQKEFQNAKARSEDLRNRSAGIQSQITHLIAQELAFRVIVNDRQPASSDDIILSEFFKTLSKNVQSSIALLTQEKKAIDAEISTLSGKLTTLKSAILVQNQKRKKLENGIKKRNELIAKLEKDLKAYDGRLSKIVQERDDLDSILEKLNIRKQKEDKRIEDKKNNDKRIASKTNLATKDRDIPSDVKRVGSSYRQVSTMRYSGKKTIAPLDAYEIEQQFGTYFDPVYKIKVFNESLILSPKYQNSNVKNVLDGKVVFAKDTPVLKKVVIVEHANQMHTIYAHLDKIAPTIRPGLRIKRGYIIGKVSERLGFEVTQKDKHINPLELIKK